MGKPSSKIIEHLDLPGQPKRYVVTNTVKIVLVTHDYKVAEKYARSIEGKDHPEKFYVSVPN